MYREDKCKCGNCGCGDRIIQCLKEQDTPENLEHVSQSEVGNDKKYMEKFYSCNCSPVCVCWYLSDSREKENEEE